MALWVCRKCGTKFAVGLPYCPGCTATDAYEEGDPKKMGKISKAAGPSIAGQSVATVEDEHQAASGGAEQGEGEPVSAAPSPAQPAVGDRKDDWVAYALSQGFSEVELEGLTKAEIVELVEDDVSD